MYVSCTHDNDDEKLVTALTTSKVKGKQGQTNDETRMMNPAYIAFFNVAADVAGKAN